MYSISFTPTFVKNYKKLLNKNPMLKARIDKTVSTLEINPFDPSIKSHKVGADKELGAIWSSRVTGDIRILWIIDSNQRLSLVLLKIGGHDYVY